MGLVLDPQLIRDLTVLITSSTAGGMILEALKQPVINGFFLAGSVVGPGGFKLIKVPQDLLPLHWGIFTRFTCMQKHCYISNFLGGCKTMSIYLTQEILGLKLVRSHLLSGHGCDKWLMDRVY